MISTNSDINKRDEMKNKEKKKRKEKKKNERKRKKSLVRSKKSRAECSAGGVGIVTEMAHVFLKVDGLFIEYKHNGRLQRGPEHSWSNASEEAANDSVMLQVPFESIPDANIVLLVGCHHSPRSY